MFSLLTPMYYRFLLPICQASLMSRVRANEKVVAIVSALGIGAGGISGTAAFAIMWDITFRYLNLYI